MVALAERLRLELDSSDRENLVGSQIIPDKSYRTNCGLVLHMYDYGVNRDLSMLVSVGHNEVCAASG